MLIPPPYLYIFSPVDTMNREQFTPEFLAMNPQHCVPTLNDNGLIVWESPAICAYLASRYGGGDAASLCPADVAVRAKIDQLLHFNNGTLLSRYLNLILPIFNNGVSEMNERQVAGIKESLELLETFLKDVDYLVGNQLTVADLSNVTTLATIFKIFPPQQGQYPRIGAWLQRLAALPYYDDAKHADAFSKKFWDAFNANKAAAAK